MDLKIILLFCIVVAVAALDVRQKAEHKSALTRIVRPPPNDPEDKAKSKAELEAIRQLPDDDIERESNVTFSEIVKIIRRGMPCPYYLDNYIYDAGIYNPMYPYLYPINAIRRRERKHRNPERARKSRGFKDTLQEVQASFNGFMNSLEAERTPDEIKESALDVMFQVFMGWQNATSKVDGSVNPEETDISTRSKKMKREQSELGKISSFCNFLSVLTGFMDQCQGREKECLHSLAQIMTEQEEKPMKRNGNAHQPVLEAVKELADRLEQSRDPNDQNMALLAKALLELYNDVQAHEPSVETNVMVILDVYNIFQKLDNCARNPQCCDDWYSAYNQSNW